MNTQQTLAPLPAMTEVHGPRTPRAIPHDAAIRDRADGTETTCARDTESERPTPHAETESNSGEVRRADAVTSQSSAKIGPNALIQTVRVMRTVMDETETAAILQECGLERLLTHAPETMVDEEEFFALADALAARLGTSAAHDILQKSGRLTAGYLLAHRIPRPFQRLLRLLPRRAAMNLLMTAIRKHAWTFVGSGVFTYTLGKRPRLTIACSRNVTMAVCGFYGGTFEQLFRTLIDANTRLEMITTPPIVRT